MAQLNEEISVNLTSVNKDDSVLAEANELLESGRKLLKEESYDSGIDQLSNALALMVENFGELDQRNSVYYVEYGKALVSQGDILTNTLKKLLQEHKKDREQTEEKQQFPLVSDAQNSTSVKPHTDTYSSKEKELSDQNKDKTREKGHPPEFLDCDVQNGTSAKSLEQTPSANVEQSSVEQIKSVGEAESAAENRELAWQLFETARVIIANDEKMDEKEKSLQLGDVHHLLGEVALGGENFDRGYEEFSTSIKLLGKSLQLSDPRIGRAQQLAGLCAVHGRQIEAAQFHYTAAAENHNMRLEELLTEAGVMEPKNPDQPESEDIEFVDRKYLDILKTKVGVESDLFKNCSEIFGIVNDLIDRVEELMEEEELKKAEVVKVMKLLSEKLKSGEIPGVQTMKNKSHGSGNSKNDGEAAATEQIGFDISQQPATAQVNKLGTFGSVKRLAPIGQQNSVTKKLRTI